MNSAVPGTQKRVACIGECMIELRHTGADTLKLGHGGDTLNTAVYLARIGKGRLTANYVTALGDDSYSTEMLAGWQTEGIDTTLVARLPGRLPGLYIIRADKTGERHFTYFRSAAAARDMLRGGHAATVARVLRAFDSVYLSGVTLSILDGEQRTSLLAMLRDLRSNGTRVTFDSNHRPAGWPELSAARRAFEQVARCTDIALPTFEDERALFGDADPVACARRLHGLGVAEVAVKLGRDGCLVSVAGSASQITPEKIMQPVDTTAAGDAFNAAYIAARLSGIEPNEAARRGNRLAAAVIMQPGAIIPRSAMPAD